MIVRPASPAKVELVPVLTVSLPVAGCWLFPGNTVQIDTPCLDCGDPIQVQIKDGVLLKAEPQSLIAYVAVPLAEWARDPGYA